MKINLIRHHISSHSFNYKDKLGVEDRELENRVALKIETDHLSM